jgi:hypothetical protein
MCLKKGEIVQLEQRCGHRDKRKGEGINEGIGREKRENVRNL